jgi:hypothetical protein
MLQLLDSLAADNGIPAAGDVVSLSEYPLKSLIVSGFAKSMEDALHDKRGV